MAAGGSKGRRTRDLRGGKPPSFAEETVNNAPYSGRVMQGIDAFLDTYVRIDDGTRVLLCAHRSCARTAAWLYSAIFLRGTEPETFLFDREDPDMEMAIGAALDELRARPGVRRVAVLVCEPAGPSFVGILEQGTTSKSDRTPIFRISGSTSVAFEAGGQATVEKKHRRGSEPSFVSEQMFDDIDEEHGLSEMDIDELLSQCGFEMAGLDDRDIEDFAAMSAEEIGSLSDEELAALAELEDSELLELAAGWGEEDFRVLA